MTTQSVVARPYATAIFEFAGERDAVNQWQVVLDNMALAVDEITQQVNRQLTEQQLAALILDIFVDQADCYQRNLLMLLAAQGRISTLPAIAEYFRELARQQAGIISVRVESAKEIADTVDFDQALSRWLSGKVETTYIKNSDLIGGVRIQIQDNVFDASVRGRLDRLAHTLL